MGKKEILSVGSTSIRNVNQVKSFHTGTPPDVRQKERDRYSDVSFKSRDHGRTVNDRHNSEQRPNYRSHRPCGWSPGIKRSSVSQKIYSNEKQNQNTRFLGYRQNPNHG